MNKSRIFLGLSLSILLCAQVVQAESLKNSEFLKFSEGQRHWWYSGTYTAIGHMVYLHDEKKAQCVWNWLFAEPKRKEALLIKSFKQYPDHTPTSIVIALLKRDCGELLPQVGKSKNK